MAPPHLNSPAHYNPQWQTRVDYSDDEESKCCGIFRRKRAKASHPHPDPEPVAVIDALNFEELVHDPLKDVIVAYYTDEVHLFIH